MKYTKFAIGSRVRLNTPDGDPRNGDGGTILEDVSDSPAHKMASMMLGIDPSQPAYKVKLDTYGTMPIPHDWLIPATVN